MYNLRAPSTTRIVAVSGKALDSIRATAGCIDKDVAEETDEQEEEEDNDDADHTNEAREWLVFSSDAHKADEDEEVEEDDDGSTTSGLATRLLAQVMGTSYSRRFSWEERSSSRSPSPLK